MRHYEAARDASDLRFAVVVARFNHLVCVRLLESCVRELEARGAAPNAIDVAWVPGAYEIPRAARSMAASGRYDAVVTLGAVIQGGTPHFDFVCQGVTDGVREVARDLDVPIAFGVLTTHTIEQAFDRTGGAEGDKGAEVAATAIEMACLCRQLVDPPPELGTA